MMEKRKKLHIAAVMLFFIFLAVFCTFKYNQLVRSSICASLLFFFIRSYSAPKTVKHMEEAPSIFHFAWCFRSSYDSALTGHNVEI